MLTDHELLTLAGKPAFARGRAYHADARIALSRHDPDGLEGEARGSEHYALWLERDGSRWRWDCACPAADGGAFCKHLVAAVLTARGDPPETASAPTTRRAKRGDDLADFLRAQSQERLAGWLLAFADEDPNIAKRLRLHRAADDPALLKSALGKMLDASGFLDYRRSLDYARRLDAVVEQLKGAIARDAAAGRALCEYALGRLLRIYARSDDSAGGIGDQLQSMAELHVHACHAAPPGKAFAKTLFALQQKDEWGLFPLDAYWNALGADGQADYGRRAVAEFEKLPQKPAAGQRCSEHFGALRRLEAFARVTGDFDLLQRVLRRHLVQPHDHLRVLKSLQQFGRAREALAWAEQTVKRFPDDVGARNALADCLAAAGLDDEAIEHAWQGFRLQPQKDNWDALKRMAGAQWPIWRERALAEVAAHGQGDATHRATLLEHDGDLDAAVAVAQESGIRPDVLERLASFIERDNPALAGQFRLRIVRLLLQRVHSGNYVALVLALRRAVRCLPPEEFRPLVAQVRAEHARKPRLIEMLDAAGL